MWPLINDVTTGATPQYPEIQPQRFSTSREKVFDAALGAAKESGIGITSADRNNGEIHGVATTRLLRFKDDVTISIARDGNETIVNIRSTSRVGKGDFGANARRIRRLQSLIASRI